MFLTKEAVRLALPGHAAGVACDGCRAGEAVSSSSRRAEANCWCARSAWPRAKLDADAFVGHARLAGATADVGMLGDETGTVFSY
jgi:hypothetical protein